MSNQEKDNFGNHEAYDAKKLEQLGESQAERIKEDLERGVENKSHEQLDEARREALEQANSVERKKEKDESKERSPAERRKPISRRDKEASFDATMHEVRSQMSAPSRAFSNFIHNPAVEKVSDAVGGTIARPNAILSGAVFAFLFTLAIYLVARFYGYPLSGGETVVSFAVGWVLGLAFDYVRLLLFGKSK